uniref:Tryptophan--tRNA ligase, mitochondrial n=2 Tax=Clastoptera arizonana TaxID=38151 RepID=A0A1B6DU64_9HEMI
MLKVFKILNQGKVLNNNSFEYILKSKKANVLKDRFLTKHYSTHGKKTKWEKKIFSGIQPTGSVHLGNYFGAIEKWIDLQNEGNDVIYCIVDLHSITLPQDPQVLKTNILQMTATLLACGIDPSKAILFRQSDVHQHTELCWILSCLSTMAQLAHFPQYKEKSATLKDVPLGLFIYPVLQAADILLYRATHVPVGQDQEQHLQMASTLARVFNSRFGSTFPSPNPLIEDSNRSRVRSLREPDKKMSKSHQDPKSRIELTDSTDSIVEKFKKAVTDCTSQITYEPNLRPGVSNLISLHSLSSGKTIQQICDENSHIDTGKYKSIVAEAVIEKIKPIREEINRLLDSLEYLEQVLENGSEQASSIAEVTLHDVKQRIGLDLSFKINNLDYLSTKYV